MSTHHIPDEVVIVGGGFSGLSIAALLAKAEVPVTLIEASDLGFEASTHNQGWLYSGAWFAPCQTELARMCYESWRKTIRFCPDCLEPGHTGMIFGFTQKDSDSRKWTTAWTDAEIPFKVLTPAQLAALLPELNTAEFGTCFHLPDRSFRPQTLLRQLADFATAHGARIHTHRKVEKLLQDDGRITSVVTTCGEEVKASFVIIATGASQADLSRYVAPEESCSQSLFTRVTLQTHLVSATSQLCRQPFCFVDYQGFNHMPHRNHNEQNVSVFGMDRWKVVNAKQSSRLDETEASLIRESIRRFFPTADEPQVQFRQWSGTTVQAMHIDQIDPGRVPLPTVIDHANESPCVSNLLSVYPGRGTLWAQLAEDAASVVLQRLERSRTLLAKPPWA